MSGINNNTCRLCHQETYLGIGALDEDDRGFAHSICRSVESIYPRLNNDDRNMINSRIEEQDLASIQLLTNDQLQILNDQPLANSAFTHMITDAPTVIADSNDARDENLDLGFDHLTQPVNQHSFNSNPGPSVLLEDTAGRQVQPVMPETYESWLRNSHHLRASVSPEDNANHQVSTVTSGQTNRPNRVYTIRSLYMPQYDEVSELDEVHRTNGRQHTHEELLSIRESIHRVIRRAQQQALFWRTISSQVYRLSPLPELLESIPPLTPEERRRVILFLAVLRPEHALFDILSSELDIDYLRNFHSDTASRPANSHNIRPRHNHNTPNNFPSLNQILTTKKGQEYKDLVSYLRSRPKGHFTVTFKDTSGSLSAQDAGGLTRGLISTAAEQALNNPALFTMTTDQRYLHIQKYPCIKEFYDFGLILGKVSTLDMAISTSLTDDFFTSLFNGIKLNQQPELGDIEIDAVEEKIEKMTNTELKTLLTTFDALTYEKPENQSYLKELEEQGELGNTVKESILPYVALAKGMSKTSEHQFHQVDELRESIQGVVNLKKDLKKIY